MAVADKDLWELGEPRISDNDHELWVLGEPWVIYDSGPAPAPPTGIEDKSANMGSKMVGAGLI